jgi:hypothetical protein
MRNGAVYNDAFLICHEIYQAARELVNSRVPTTQLTSASKFLWRPDLHPRLVEFVADFARCGERALSAGRTGSGGEVAAPRRGTSYRPEKPRDSARAFRPRHTSLTARPRDGDAPGLGGLTSGGGKPPRASRLILFRLYYLGGAEYEAARHVMGLSERTWSDWAEEVRARVGSELIRAGMYPPARYFRQASTRPAETSAPRVASTNGAPKSENEFGDM